MDYLEKVFLECQILKDGRRYHHKLGWYSHIVWNFYNSHDLKVKGDGQVIHHKDEDPGNEKIENLQKMKNGEHTILHNTGKTYSYERKRNISLALSGEKHPMFGNYFSEDHKKKLSLANMGEKNPMYGKQHSQESRRKMSEIKMGKHFSEETRMKMSSSQKRRRLKLKETN
jgi:hypothetical protein